MKFINSRRISEANIQAEIYHQCKLNSINCYLEYKVPGNKPRSRLDIVILDNDDNITLIIEVKSYIVDKLPNLNTRQIRKYLKYGIPIVVIGRMENIYNLIKGIKSQIYKEGIYAECYSKTIRWKENYNRHRRSILI